MSMKAEIQKNHKEQEKNRKRHLKRKEKINAQNKRYERRKKIEEWFYSFGVEVRTTYALKKMTKLIEKAIKEDYVTEYSMQGKNSEQIICDTWHVGLGYPPESMEYKMFILNTYSNDMLSSAKIRKKATRLFQKVCKLQGTYFLNDEENERLLHKLHVLFKERYRESFFVSDIQYINRDGSTSDEYRPFFTIYAHVEAGKPVETFRVPKEGDVTPPLSFSEEFTFESLDAWMSEDPQAKTIEEMQILLVQKCEKLLNERPVGRVNYYLARFCTDYEELRKNPLNTSIKAQKQETVIRVGVGTNLLVYFGVDNATLKINRVMFFDSSTQMNWFCRDRETVDLCIEREKE